MEAALQVEAEAMNSSCAVNNALMLDNSRLAHAMDRNSQRLVGTRDSDLAALFAHSHSDIPGSNFVWVTRLMLHKSYDHTTQNEVTPTSRPR